MSRTVGICFIFLLTFQVSYAVILRPKWFPYFPRQSQALDLRYVNSDLAALTTDTRAARQARTTETEEVPICHDRLTDKECLNRLLMVIRRVLKREHQRELL